MRPATRPATARAETFLGSGTVTTDGSGNASFNRTLGTEAGDGDEYRDGHRPGRQHLRVLGLRGGGRPCRAAELGGEHHRRQRRRPLRHDSLQPARSDQPGELERRRGPDQLRHPGRRPPHHQPTSPLPTSPRPRRSMPRRSRGSRRSHRARSSSLDGTSAGSTTEGLTISAANTTVRGLAINRFGRSGILATGQRRGRSRATTSAPTRAAPSTSATAGMGSPSTPPPTP